MIRIQESWGVEGRRTVEFGMLLACRRLGERNDLAALAWFGERPKAATMAFDVANSLEETNSHLLKQVVVVGPASKCAPFESKETWPVGAKPAGERVWMSISSGFYEVYLIFSLRRCLGSVARSFGRMPSGSSPARE